MLNAFEDLEFGGVDSRSNPLNMPQNRALRCLNWVPRQAGYLELRWGYGTATLSTVTATAIHSLIPYAQWSGSRFLLIGRGTGLVARAQSDGTVTAPTVKGTAIASSAKWAAAPYNNHLHLANGTDQKWYDGTTLRDSGLRAPTALEVANVVILDGIREFTVTEASNTTVTTAPGGSFAAAVNGGIQCYVAIFNPALNELGPSTLAVSGGVRVKTTANQKLTFSSLPDLTSYFANVVKLVAGTADGATSAFFYTNTSTFVNSCTRSGTSVTVISVAHGLSTGDVVILSGTGDFDGVCSITRVDNDTFTFAQPYFPGRGANSTGGLCKRAVVVATATTTVDVLAPTQDTSIIANANRGLPVSTVGGAQPGYVFYASIYNPTAGGHVGNRIQIGGRYRPGGTSPAAGRYNVSISGLPDYFSADPEWNVLIGRSGDGAELPYAVMDQAGNWIYALQSQTAINLTQADIDGNSELPTRNGVIPSQVNLLATVGDYMYAADTASPTIRRSGSTLASVTGDFVGDPAQSWAGNDIQTFPTAQATVGIAEVDYELFVGTQSDSAVLTDLSGTLQWRGPWAVGLAGKRAMCKTTYGFYFISGEKQLCTFQNGVPVPVSEEYEASLLANIGDTYLSTVECVYIRDVAKGKDEIRIECRDASGNPFTIIHDFKLRDARSLFGQGYNAKFLGPLATAFTSAAFRDANGKAAVFAGDSTGHLYQLYNGGTDAGNEFSADGVLLISGGTQRPSVPFMDWYGDSNVVVSVGTTLDSTLAGLEVLASDAAQGYENDSMYRAKMTQPEIRHCYVRLQLTSHSADGNLTLNDPPHLPLETYGRIYDLIPDIGKQRGR